ncbi:AraC family transcriptional regulator [Bosea caraganae]|uniref:AraC family transcriptional regulator n=1 Tax=Bosea caraganae TaxID=2763117 RepID=A0A370LCZ6_9HYPH|nr:AraC family transcriptional regulator [Bosea caraganae]RDJ27829.1 AraC family transcriptional regulator [Bosea caraganae]RDJ29842.1 AraC family transcriptional regulator [Bosea caraganae]
MFSWSTDHIAPRERFEHWREVRAKGVFGVTAELDPDQDGEFKGSMTIRPLGAAALVELHATPYRVSRTRADIARAPSDSLCLYQQLDGGGWFEAARGGEFVTPRGTLATSHSDLPYSTAPMTAAGFHLRVLKIPNGAALTRRAHELVAMPLDDRVPVTALIQSCFSDLAAKADNLDSAQAESLVQALAQLTLIARGVAEARSESSRAALRVGRLSAARYIIGRDADRASLSPAFVAGQLGISVRHLHALFEPTGQSFSQSVTAARLAEACRRLRQHPSQPVADIAFACGFDSLATFHRVFRAAFYMPPGDYRRSLQGKGPDG